MSIAHCCALRHPAPILVSGPTGCGKTQFLSNLLLRKMIQPEPERIIYVYGDWQPAYDKIKEKYPHAEFVKDFDDSLYDTLQPTTRNLVVFDDQMSNEDARNNTGLMRYFTQGSHHRNATVVYIVQNLFDKGKAMRTASLNSHYIILFKNPRDKGQVRSLAQQMYPQNTRFLVRAFEDATQRPYEHMLIDLKPDTPEALRLRSNTLDDTPIVYVPQPDTGRLLSLL